ncbi:hypothetical protein MRX96_029989 [Rhipicephalus microplus]
MKVKFVAHVLSESLPIAMSVNIALGEPRAEQAVITETFFPSETSGDDLLDITEKNALYFFVGGITQPFLKNSPDPRGSQRGQPPWVVVMALGWWR